MADFVIMPIEDYRRACEAVRTKTGGTEDITSGELEAQILSIETGVRLPVLVSPGAAAQLLEGYQLIDQDGNIVDGSMPVVELNTPFINVDEVGKITAIVEQAKGYVEGGTKEATRTLLTQGAKTVTPNKSTQTAVEKYRYTTGAVKVGPIPNQYQDVSRVTATAELVKAGAKFVDRYGTVVTGTMPTSETVIDDISVLDSGYVQVWVKSTIGYNAGTSFNSGMQLPVGGGATITPTKSAQTAVSKGVYTTAPVMVAAIPDKYQDVSGVTAAPADVLRGKKIQTVVGELEGTMPNNGKTSGTLDGLNTTSVSVPEGYTEGGEITFDDTALAARIDAI